MTTETTSDDTLRVGQIAASLHEGKIFRLASGVTALDMFDFAPIPFLFLATTENLYVVPLFSSHKVHDVPSEDVVQVDRVGYDDTTYRVMAEPPFRSGRDQYTVTNPLPGVAWTERGAVRDTPAVPFTRTKMTTTVTAMRKAVTIMTTLKFFPRIGHLTIGDVPYLYNSK